MIFVTVGSDRYPFDRLLRAVEDAYVRHQLTDEIIFQYGSCLHAPSIGRTEAFIPFREVRSLVGRATIVVTHAGVGSIGLCLTRSMRPIVLPRQSSLGEAVDDHQISYAEHMEKEGYIWCARSVAELQNYVVEAANGRRSLSVVSYREERKRLCDFLAQHVSRDPIA